MGFFQDLFGNSSETVSSIPPYLEAFFRDKITPRLEGMVDRPYPVYTDPRLKDFDPMEEQAFRYAGENVDNPEWRPYFGRATEMLEAGAQPYDAALLGPEGEYDPALLGEGGSYDRFEVGETERLTPEAVSRYMDPYKGQVVDTAVRRIEENADKAALRDRARATRTGNLYSAGHGLIDAERDKNVSREIGDVTGRLMSEGYRDATSQFNRDVDRQLSARTGDVGRRLTAATSDVGARNRAVEFLMSQGLTREQANQAARNRSSEFNRTQAMAGSREMAGQGSQRQTLRNQDFEALRGAGAQRRGLGQQGLDLAYKDFLEQRDWPLSNLSQISQIASGQPYTRTQTSTQTPSMFNTLAGGALVGSRLFPGAASTVGSWLGFADGGVVRGPKGPALAHKRKAAMMPGRREMGGLPPPRGK